MICASEQSVVVVDSVYDKVREELVRRGCYFLKDEEEKDKVGLVVVGGTRACWWGGVHAREWPAASMCVRASSSSDPAGVCRCPFSPPSMHARRCAPR